MKKVMSNLSKIKQGLLNKEPQLYVRLLLALVVVLSIVLFSVVVNNQNKVSFLQKEVELAHQKTKVVEIIAYGQGITDHKAIVEFGVLANHKRFTFMPKGDLDFAMGEIKKIAHQTALSHIKSKKKHCFETIKQDTLLCSPFGTKDQK